MRADPRPEPPETVYGRRLERYSAEAELWAGRSRAFSWARLVMFLAFLGCAFMVLLEASSVPTGWIGASVALLGVFGVLVVCHDRVIRNERCRREMVSLQRWGLARLDHDWDALPEPGPVRLPGDDGGADPGDSRDERELPPVARDLHLFGHASLFHLLGPHLSPPGRDTLARWLLEPATAEQVARRQAAVEELAPRVDLRQELARRAARLTEADSEVEPFLEWAEGEPWLVRRPVRNAVSFLAPAVALVALAAWGVGWIPFALAVLPLWLNLALAYLLGGEIHDIFDRVSSREAPFQHYARLLEVLDGEGFRTELMVDEQRRLTSSGLSAARQMDLLHQRVTLSDSRHSAPLNFLLEATFLWSFHVLRLLEGWQRRCGGEARGWLEALGEIEALAALARLRFDHPDWCFPRIVADGPAKIEAEALAHPLLPAASRVANDVAVGPPGTFVLVTGSNMSGKSTLLRALGVNAVLAEAGAPVCARSMTLPPLTLGTSILIEDSLEDGVSFFMAELLRLKHIVAEARRARRRGRTLLYLLDEVLRGTNSRERRLAAREILQHLLEAGAIGAVSTHDPALLDAEELRAAAEPVHFRETLHPGREGRQVMTFDYRLRPGVSTGGNAMKLLELVGLGADDDG